jgi:hypothetical protein
VSENVIKDESSLQSSEDLTTNDDFQYLKLSWTDALSKKRSRPNKSSQNNIQSPLMSRFVVFNHLSSYRNNRLLASNDSTLFR